MMGSINIFSLLFILKLLQTDASINIYQSGVQAGSGHFECGEEFVLTCQIDSYSVSMALQNDSSNVPLAECFLNTCTLNPDVANRYTLSTNTATGTFNLTFNVSNYHNGTTFMCDDASNSKSSLFLMNDYEPNIIETNQTQLEVMSGCINSGVTVTFLWKKVEAKTMTESEYKFDFSNKHEYSNATICELDEECGGQGLIKRIISIDVEEEGTDEYYLKAILSYPGVKKEILTSKTYKIKQVSGPFICVWIVTDYVLTICIGITFCLHHIAAFVIIYKKDLCFRSTFANTALISTPIYICLALCIANWIRCSCTNPCSSCEYMCVLRYIWIAVVLVNWGLGFYRLHKIRKLCDKKDFTGVIEERGVIYLVEDTEFLISLFCFIILTYVLLLIVWIFYKIVKSRRPTYACTKSDKEANTPKINQPLPPFYKKAAPSSSRDQMSISDHVYKLDQNRQRGERQKTEGQPGKGRNNMEGSEKLKSPKKSEGKANRNTAGIPDNNSNKVMSINTGSKKSGSKKQFKKGTGQSIAMDSGAHDDTGVNSKIEDLLQNEDGKKGEDTKTTNKDNLEHSGGQNGAKNGKTARDPSSETAHDLYNRNDNKSGNKHNYDEKAQNSDKNQGQKAHDQDKRIDNKSGPEQEDIIKNSTEDKAHGQNGDENQDQTAHDLNKKNDNESGPGQEDTIKDSTADKAHGQNSDENQGNMANVHRTQIFVTRPAQSNIVVQPLDDNTVQQSNVGKQSSKTHNDIPRGISTVFNDPDANDPQPA